MTNGKVLVTALLVAASAVVFAVQVSAQDRDAAISACVRAAQQQWPSDSVEHSTNRTAAYKACMTKAGFAP